MKGRKETIKYATWKSCLARALDTQFKTEEKDLTDNIPMPGIETSK